MFHYPNSITKTSILLKVLNGCFDSLPAVNSDTSLPIKYRDVASFPNYRYSFYPYNSKASNYSKLKDKLSPYAYSLESSIAPYGYEHEECFAKHPENGYHTGKNTREFSKDWGSFIECINHNISISYISRSNTFIVRSSFNKDHRKVFFKQTNKLISEVKGQIKWRSYEYLDRNFTKMILNHLSNVDPKLERAISSVPNNVMNYRTILNNPFWKDTQATFLLEKTNLKLRKKCQRHYRKKKDFLSTSNFFGELPDDFSDRLRNTSSLRPSHLSLVKELYDFVLEHTPELATFDFINPSEWTWYANINFSSLVEPEFDQYLIDYRHSLKNITEAINNFRSHTRDFNNARSLGYKKIRADFNSYQELIDDMRLFCIQKTTRGIVDKQKREVVQLKDKEIIFNPTLKEILAAVPDANLVIDPKTTATEFCMIGDTVYSSPIHVLNDLSFTDILLNADVLSSKFDTIKTLLKSEEAIIQTEKESTLAFGDDLPF